MMLKSILVAAAFAASALAQGILIGQPTPGTTIFPGEVLTVEVDKPDSLTGSTDVSLQISIAEIGCDNPTCIQFPGPATVLYNGPYHPVDHKPSSSTLFEIFTLTIPNKFQQGDIALLTVKHKVLVGASQIESDDSQSVVLKVVKAPGTKRAVAGRIML